MHVVVIGLDKRKDAKREKRLFSYPDINGAPEESLHMELSPYLFDASGLADPNLVVFEERKTLNSMPSMRYGSQPIDGSHFIFTAEERICFLSKEPDAEPFLRPFVGSREYLQGGERSILVLHDIEPKVLSDLPRTRERVRRVREYRLKSKRLETRKLAQHPRSFAFTTIPNKPFLIIPEVSSERREYIPIGWLEPPVIPSSLVRVLENATLADFALLTSAMHMAWLRYVGGRLESRYRYSIGLVYNTFPVPPRRDKLSKLEPFAQAVLDARHEHPESTLAELYDPDLMPSNLLRAHKELDRAVDRLYKRGGFSSERERIEHLFFLYEKMLASLRMTSEKKPKRGRRVIIHRK